MGTFKTGLNKFLGLRQPYNSAGSETGGIKPPDWVNPTDLEIPTGITLTEV